MVVCVELIKLLSVVLFAGFKIFPVFLFFFLTIVGTLVKLSSEGLLLLSKFVSLHFLELIKVCDVALVTSLCLTGTLLN